MKLFNRYIKSNFLKIMCSLFLFTIVLFTNHFFYPHTPYETYLYPYSGNLFYAKLILLRIIDFFLIYIFVHLIFYFFKTFDYKNSKHKLFLEAFLISLLFLLIGFFKLYPGVWQYDTLHLLEYASTLETVPWHNIYTSLFYIIPLSIIPSPNSIILTQILLFTCIISYIYSNIFSKYPTKFRFFCFLFLLTPINQFYSNWAFRTTISAYFELFAIFYTIFHLNKTINKKHFFLFCLLIAFISTYRSENIFYIILPLLLIKSSFKSIMKWLLVIVLLLIIVNTPQKMISKQYYKSDYLIITTFEPLQYVLNSLPDDNKTVLKEKENIEKTIPLEYIKNYGYHSYFEYNYEKNGFATVASKEEQSSYLLSVSKLFFNNYKLFLKSKINSFTTMLVGKTYYPTSPIYSLRTEYYFNEQYNNIVTYSANKYHFKTGFVSLNTINKLLLPIAILLVCLIVSMLMRKKIFWIFLPLLFKIPTIIIFAPVCSFMYFYYIYIIGYLLFIYFVAQLFFKIKALKK